jgi:16S rRNA G966 N2-methylase RsmD
MYKPTLIWLEFYNQVRGVDWPNCNKESDVQYLPDSVKEELKRFGYNYYRTETKKWQTNGIDTFTLLYNPELDGGGTDFGQDYIATLKKYNRLFNRCYEWCSGPGFIGFEILSHRLCNSLCLSDFYYSAIDYIEQTIKENNCANKVTAYLLKDLALLPAVEKFDLVVANPPHVEVRDIFYYNANRISCDSNWQAHRNFFKNIKNHLTDDGIILLQEAHEGSTPETFKHFVNDAGLKITDHYGLTSNSFDENRVYYLEIRHNENLS